MRSEMHIYLESKAQLALIKKAAALQGRSASNFALRAILAAAEQEIAKAPKPEKE